MVCENISLCVVPAIFVGYLIKYILKSHGKETFLFYHHEKDPFLLIEVIKESDSKMKKYLFSIILILYFFSIGLFVKGVFNSIGNVTYAN